MDNLFIANSNENQDVFTPNQLYTYKRSEIVVTHYNFNNNVVAVAISGDTIPLKRYLNGEEVYTTKDKPAVVFQCPLLFKYTSTENGQIDNLHKFGINLGKLKGIHNFDDNYPDSWRTNGKAYVRWVVGPQQIQMKNQGKY